MKQLVLTGILMVVASLTFAQPPQTQKKTFISRTNRPRPSQTAPPLRRENTEGSLARAVRGGNPLQLLNPRAPAVYGRAEDNVFLDPDTGKWKGFRLLTINF